jgi:hypothetical protein
MANFSNHLENAIISWLNGTTMPAATGSLWVALYTGALDQSNAATNLIGFTTPRKEVADWSVTTASNSSDSVADASITNTSEIVMTTSSTVAATASHFGVFNALTGGELLFHGQLTGSVPIAISDNVKFAPGAITLTVQ